MFECSNVPDVVDGHKSRVFGVCFNPKSAHELISAGWDNTIQFWDTRQAHSLRFISDVHICGDALDISKNGKEVHFNFYFMLIVSLKNRQIYTKNKYMNAKYINKSKNYTLIITP